MHLAKGGSESSVSDKQELRLRLRETRDKVSPSWRRLLARAAANRALPILQGRETVAVYHAIRSELDPVLLVESLRARGARIVYPRVAPSSPILEFYEVKSTEQLEPGPFGLLEPSNDAPLLTISEIDAFVVPGLSFDRAGNRLGWGKGYYDHTLAQNSRALRVGLCFQEQIEPSLPNDTNDQSMDWVVTDAKAFQGQERGALDALPVSSPKVQT